MSGIVRRRMRKHEYWRRVCVVLIQDFLFVMNNFEGKEIKNIQGSEQERLEIFLKNGKKKGRL